MTVLTKRDVLERKQHLPLTTGYSTFVRLYHTRHDAHFLALYENLDDEDARFCADLKDASIVNNITENGPCLFLICKNGQFEFQTTGKEMFSDWLQIFKDCGIPLIPFSQLYKLQKLVGEGSFAKVYL
eukprot:Lankesteria_metandrocarpae@DN8313_c0_g1_i1.p1